MIRAALFIFGLPILGILIALATGCGDIEAPYCDYPEVAASVAPIVNGTPSVDRRSTASISGPTGGCTATVIGPHTVLTAAHCAEQGAPTDILVEGIGWFDVLDGVTHEEYVFPMNDLHILYTQEVLPEPYATLATTEVVCASTIAQGYGYGGVGLHERAMQETGHFADQILGTSAIAPGDSGGPLWAITADGPLLLGVASWGFGSAPDYEGETGHISVPYHYDWIQERIK